METKVKSILQELGKLGDPERADGMAAYGINIEQAYGIRIPVLRGMAREIGRDHALALDLWDTGKHEARILASMIDDPEAVTEAQMDSWASDFNSWDLCDQVTGNLFDKTSYARKKVYEWSSHEEVFIKRAAFALIAWGAIHWKKASDDEFEAFFPLILRQATDPRNYVRKAVNWSLRNIGKRNYALNRKAVKLAEQIAAIEDPTARWIAADALRELTDETRLAKLKVKSSTSTGL